MLVVVPVSSTNTRRLKSSPACSARQTSRMTATSGRSCSVAYGLITGISKSLSARVWSRRQHHTVSFWAKPSLGERVASAILLRLALHVVMCGSLFPRVAERSR